MRNEMKFFVSKQIWRYGGGWRKVNENNFLIVQITHASIAGLAKGTEWLLEMDLELSEFAIVTNSLSKCLFFFR